MKKITSIIVVACLSVCTSFKSFANPERSLEKIVLPEVSVLESDVGEAISPLKKGNRAPFTGILLSPEAVAKIKVDLDSIDDLIKIENEKITNQLNAEFVLKLNDMSIKNKSDIQIFEARVESLNFQNEDLSSKLQREIKNRPNKWLWFITGVGIGIGLTLGIIFSLPDNN